MSRNRLRRRDGIDECAFPVGFPPLGLHAPPCLIVAPASVVENWNNELQRWGFFLVQALKAGSSVDDVVDEARTGVFLQVLSVLLSCCDYIVSR